MSASSSWQTLDLKMSNGGVRRLRSRQQSASLFHDELDGRTDSDDYCGQQDDVSDMKVGSESAAESLRHYC